MNEPPTLVAAILIVSDTAHTDPSTDGTTSALLELLEKTVQPCRWRVSSTKIVPDQHDDIQNAICDWCDSGAEAKSADPERPNLVITAGGTGFATRDHTPEAVDPLLERKAPGFV